MLMQQNKLSDRKLQINNQDDRRAFHEAGRSGSREQGPNSERLPAGPRFWPQKVPNPLARTRNASLLRRLPAESVLLDQFPCAAPL